MVRKKQTTTLPEPPRAIQAAGYGRVSTGRHAMLESLSAQVSYYSSFIQSHPGWQYVGVYADEAYTGTKDTRPEFQRMLNDCRAGKIDIILVKSLSRFARNTVTLLETVRELKALGIDVWFERENIHTMSAEGEVLLTLIAAAAQEESRSVSDNCKWRIRKQFEAGELATLRFMYGYNVTCGQITINDNEASVVRKMFSDYIHGTGATEIAKRLADQNQPTLFGGEWTAARVLEILKNEKYTGNAILQKQFITDHLTKTKAVNRGQLPQYYVEGSHPAIIDKETFEQVQAIIYTNKEKYRAGETPPVVYPFSGLLTCGCCGKNYTRKAGPKHVLWKCSTFLKRGKACCSARSVPDEVIVQAVHEILGVDIPDSRLIRIVVQELGHLKLELSDGQNIDYEWTPRSRRESWDEEAREKARQHALKRRTK